MPEPELKPLPACPYRGPEIDGSFPCEAAEGAPVTASDCRSCSIPQAIADQKACLYLIPMRHEGHGLFVCHCYSTRVTLLAAKDWRRLCFCNYWFPRGPADRELATRFAAARNLYRRVLRDQVLKEPGGVSATTPPDGKPSSNRFSRWLRWQLNWWFR